MGNSVGRGVPTSCPVCEAPVDEDADHCSKCGLPALLRGRLDGPLTDPPEVDDTPVPEPAPRLGTAMPREGPEAEVNASLAKALEERTELLLTIDPDAPDVTGELCEAALSEAAGRVSEAQQVLRSAQGRLDRETEELLARHLESLETRGRLLESSGLRLALDEELGTLAESMVASGAASSVAALREAEHRMDGIEAHWRGLQGLISQVTTLRQQAAELGIGLDHLSDPLASVRSNLATKPATERDLDVAAQVATQALMQLHEAIPPALERELGAHAKTIEAHRGKRSRAQSARRHHADAVRHLAEGRLEDAVHSIRELREALEELAREIEEPPPPPAPSAPTPPPPVVAATTPAPTPVPSTPPAPEATAAAEPAPPPAPPPRTPSREATPAAAPPAAAPPPGAPDAEVVATLMKKARSLAVRVRSLPPDSEEAARAAREIHAATELLRAGRYSEADAALSRIMRSLVGARGGS